MVKKKYRPGLSRRVLFSLVVLIILLAAIVFLVVRHQTNPSARPSSKGVQPSSSVNYGPSSPTDNQSNEERKSNATGTSIGSSPSKAGSTTLNSPATPPPFSVTVSRANAYEGGVSVAATINGATATGMCTFTLSPSKGQGAPITQNEPSRASNSSYICPGLNIAAPKGSWKVSVTVTSGSRSVKAEWAANPVVVQ